MSGSFFVIRTGTQKRLLPKKVSYFEISSCMYYFHDFKDDFCQRHQYPEFPSQHYAHWVKNVNIGLKKIF